MPSAAMERKAEFGPMLRRFGGVSEAGAASRNPERSEGF